VTVYENQKRIIKYERSKHYNVIIMSNIRNNFYLQITRALDARVQFEKSTAQVREKHLTNEFY